MLGPDGKPLRRIPDNGNPNTFGNIGVGVDKENARVVLQVTFGKNQQMIGVPVAMALQLANRINTLALSMLIE